MSKKAIRYGWEPKVRTTTRGDITRKSGISNDLSVSLNPFLEKYQYFRKDIAGPMPCKAILLDFDELLQEAEKATFFTYIKDISTKKSKVVVQRYPFPACVPEMEVRFSYEGEKEFQGKVSLMQRELVEAVKWTELVDIAEELSQKLLSEEYENSFEKCGIDLNAYCTLKQCGILKGKNRDKAEEAFEPTVKLITEYDQYILKIARKIRSELNKGARPR